MKLRKIINDHSVAKKVMSFLANSTDDYVAARVLFNSGLPQQAAILSSTAIEKSFKAVIALSGNESHGHLKKAHWNALRNFDHELYSMFNEDFFKLCQKVYDLRYTDNLSIGYDAVIASREFLAELDYTILQIQGRLSFSDEHGKAQVTRLDNMMRENDFRLYQDNHVLSGEDKQAFIYCKPQRVYEVRNLGRGDLLEITYSTTSKPRDQSFGRAAWKPKDNLNKSFELSFEPIQ